MARNNPGKIGHLVNPGDGSIPLHSSNLMLWVKIKRHYN